MLATLLALPCHAAVTHLEVVSTNTIAASHTGMFGTTGAAERITARATIALDPADPRNQVIVDLDKAPRNAQGRVEAVADVVIVRPEHSNGSLLLELPNRGSSQIFGILDDLDTPTGQRLDQAGNGFLLAKGYTLVLVAWQGDIAAGKGMQLKLPRAIGLSGYSRDQWAFADTQSTKRVTLSWPINEASSARIAIRATPDSALSTPAGLAFRLIDESTLEITRPAGASGAGTYEFSYIAKDPAIMGMGFAAVRDVATFLIHDTSAANPLARSGRSTVHQAIATGVSQTGRALRDLLYFGFNEDELGRQVFAGMLPIIPGTRRSFTNARFAQPGRNPGPEADQLYPVDQFPFTYDVLEDKLTGRKDGLLLRCRRTHTCPKILEFNSEYEFWGARGGLLVTDTAGKAIDLPAEVRAYMLAGAPHSNAWNAVSKRDADCAMPSSPVIAGPAIRALLTALNRWIDKNELPPPSRYPSVAAGTLVAAAEVYPKGLPLPYRGQYLHAPLVEQTSDGPVIKGEYPVLLPKADADGNAIAGIHLPIVAVPRATYTGWNPQVARSGPQDLCDHAASMVPFTNTKAERVADGDPRLSLEERYPTRDAYLKATHAAVDKLVADRLLLKEDAAASVAAAEAVK